MLPFVLLAALFTSSVYATPRSVVVWHGLGDSATAPGMIQFAEEIKQVHPGIFVHAIYIEEGLNEDRRAGFYGNVNDQIQLVAEQLAAIPELEDGFDAIGFSQGGQFLRAYVERFNSPPVHNLITFGSQHFGISDIPTCGPRDLLCQVARRAVKGVVYGSWAQSNMAQYFRDPTRLEEYYAANSFLTSINNEIAEVRNATYARNFASLNKLVLVLFTEDKTVVPKGSSWFASEVVSDEVALGRSTQQVLSEGRTLVPMREQALYVEDWIGLRQLDERGDVVFVECEGEHMVIDDCWKDLVAQYAG
ncbi:Alpha/Beta hydrolase protein [Mycena amicta]|nr:Alpha/Beta hydrolase protein [Mycena amicta]